MPVPEFYDSGVPHQQTAVLADLFDQAAQKMRDTVLSPKGKTQKAREFRAGRAAEQLRQVDEIKTALKAGVATWCGADATITAAVHAARQTADTQAEQAGVRPKNNVLSGSFSLIDVKTAAVFARDIAADLYGAADSMGLRSTRILRATQQQKLSENDLDQILAVGTIEGKPRDTFRNLRKELEAVSGKTVDVDGRNYETKYYAELVARTKTREAVTVARHERLAEIGIDLVAIIGRKSRYWCSAFLGQVFSISGKHPKYPPLSKLKGPPFHPHCSKSTRAFVEELASPEQLAAAELLPDAEKLIGVDQATAQKRFKDLQIGQQVEKRYADKSATLYSTPKPTPPAPATPAPIAAKPAAPTPTPAATPEQQADDVHAAVMTAGKAAESTIAALRTEIAAIPQQAIDRWNDYQAELAAGQATRSKADVQAEIDAMWSRRTALQLQADAARKAGANALFAAIKWPGKPANVPLVGDAKIAASPTVKAGHRVLCALLGEGHPFEQVAPLIQLVHATPNAKGKVREFFRPHDWSALAKGGEIHATPKTDESTVLHEYTHAVESSSAVLAQASKDFRDRRAGAETPRKLNDIWAAKGVTASYEDHEIAIEDKLFNPYCGKHYPRSVPATEILTMGIEQLVRDPYAFARSDPEYFKFVIAQFRRRQ